MANLKVVKIESDAIVFNDGTTLTSNHIQDCCEYHELTFSDLKMDDFDGLEFNLSNDDFFKRIEGFGIELMPVNGFGVKIPAHGYNSGAYGIAIDLVITDPNKVERSFDISDCQTISD